METPLQQEPAEMALTNAPTKDGLQVPTAEEMREIGRKQDERAKEIAERRRQQREKASAVDNADEERDRAAKVIQKNYRGYRARRALKGFGLDPGTRWMELLKDAKYHNSTQPMSKHQRSTSNPAASTVRDRWKRIGTIAHRAGSDDTSTESDLEVSNDEERAKLRERKRKQKQQREKYAKVMGIEYFLEMVDHKHRYGSNLRRYHVEWKKSETNENFFYVSPDGHCKCMHRRISFADACESGSTTARAKT
jgi:hypothetical protein